MKGDCKRKTFPRLQPRAESLKEGRTGAAMEQIGVRLSTIHHDWAGLASRKNRLVLLSRCPALKKDLPRHRLGNRRRGLEMCFFT